MVTRDKQNLTIETLSLSNLNIYHVHIAELMMHVKYLKTLQNYQYHVMDESLCYMDHNLAFSKSDHHMPRKGVGCLKLLIDYT